MSSVSECSSPVTRIDLASAKSKTLDLTTSKMVSTNGVAKTASNGHHHKEHHHSGGSDSNDTVSSGSTASKLSMVFSIPGNGKVTRPVEIDDVLSIDKLEHGAHSLRLESLSSHSLY